MGVVLHTVSIDDLVETLAHIANTCETATTRMRTGQAVTGRTALEVIRWEALDAITRTEREQ